MLHFKTFGLILLFLLLAPEDLQAGEKMDASEVSWVFEVAIKEGEVENLKALIGEMSERAETTEPGTLRFEWMISDDLASGQVHERYMDSEAALTHLASFNENFADRLMALVDPERMIVYGSPSNALKRELAGAKPVYMQRVGGFAR